MKKRPTVLLSFLLVAVFRLAVDRLRFQLPGSGQSQPFLPQWETTKSRGSR